MDNAAMAALVYLVATAIVVGFQVLLIIGAPWGEYAMGGSFPGRLPAALRMLAIAHALVLSVLALVVLSQAGLIAPDLTNGRPWLIWVVVAITAAGVVLNAASRSAGERRLWVPVSLVMLSSSVVVAVSSG